MGIRVGDLLLDARRFEVSRAGEALSAEPQVLAVLFHLLANRDRLVTKDELVEVVWNGRAISDSALSSRIKSARQLLGDDGDRQHFIRTVHGRGFRFVAPVEETLSPGNDKPIRSDRPSIAILPFATFDPRLAVLGHGLPHELIVALSRFGSLKVIARGSSFQFGQASDPVSVGARLGADYLLTGAIHDHGAKVIATVELVETAGGTVVDGQGFEGRTDDFEALRLAMLTQLIASLDLRIAHHEADRIALQPIEELGPWSLYHRALQRMFRFTPADNEEALGLLDKALALDPGLARAHAALSFARFQNAFMHYRDDWAAEASAARRSAERAVELDEQDPSANLMLGRALWLDGRVDDGLPWIERAVSLCPSYAQAIYARAWSEMIQDRPSDGQRSAGEALGLSPLDPLRYAFCATSAFTRSMLGEVGEGAALADRAAREPRAHAMIGVMAAICQHWADDGPRARHWVDEVKQRAPDLTGSIFLRSFPFRDGPTRSRVAAALNALNL